MYTRGFKHDIIGLKNVLNVLNNPQRLCIVLGSCFYSQPSYDLIAFFLKKKNTSAFIVIFISFSIQSRCFN